MSIIGNLILKPDMSLKFDSSAFPFCIKHTSVLVPPISNVIKSLNFVFTVVSEAPTTPAAGPERAILTGKFDALVIVVRPPLD